VIAMKFECHTDVRADGSPLLTLTGTLDFNSAARIREDLRQIIDKEPKQVIVDLNALDYIDSSGLGVLVGGLARLREAGGDLFLVVSNAKIRRIFEITKLSYVFSLFPDLTAVP
jgi:anti-sigma B factor antagonist